MILKIFTVYDIKSKTYLPPFYQKETGEATRAFRSSVNNPDHQFHKYPEDFSLHQIGTFDDNTSELTYTKAKLINTALQLFQEPEEQQMDLLKAVLEKLEGKPKHEISDEPSIQRAT